MDELINALVQTVTTNGGSMEWGALMATVEYKDRQKVPAALRLAKQQQKLWKRQTYSAEAGLSPLMVTTTKPTEG